MGQLLLFLAAVNSVPWALYFLLQDQAAEGEVWALFAWLLPTVWSPTIVALLRQDGLMVQRASGRRSQACAILAMGSDGLRSPPLCLPLQR